MKRLEHIAPQGWSATHLAVGISTFYDGKEVPLPTTVAEKCIKSFLGLEEHLLLGSRLSTLFQQFSVYLLLHLQVVPSSKPLKLSRKATTADRKEMNITKT